MLPITTRLSRRHDSCRQDLPFVVLRSDRPLLLQQQPLVSDGPGERPNDSCLPRRLALLDPQLPFTILRTCPTATPWHPVLRLIEAAVRDFEERDGARTVQPSIDAELAAVQPLSLVLGDGRCRHRPKKKADAKTVEAVDQRLAADDHLSSVNSFPRNRCIR